jgi:hypothetical protein
MKKSILVLTLGLIFLAFTQVHAALIWYGDEPLQNDDYYDFSYRVGNPENGTFTQVNPYSFNEDISQVREKSKDGGQAYDSTIGANNLVGGVVRFRAGSKGSSTGMISPENGLEVQGYAMINFLGGFDYSNHGVSANQTLGSYVTRRFSVDQAGDYKFDASLDGTLNMPDSFDLGEGMYPYYANYSLTGGASIYGFKLAADGFSLIPMGEVASFTWNDEIGSGEDVVSLIPNQDGLDVLYQLVVSLSMEANVCNGMMDWITPKPEGAPDFDNSALGTIDDPLMVTASLSAAPVPIPSALVLLFSGLGGLAAMGRRGKRS